MTEESQIDLEEVKDTVAPELINVMHAFTTVSPSSSQDMI